MTFLEIVGLRQERRVEQEAQLDRFRLYHAEFRKLLSANNSFLETMSELEQRTLGRSFCNLAYLQPKVVRLVSDIHHMVESINVISDRRYQALGPGFDEITARLTAALAAVPAPAPEERILDLSEIEVRHADRVGGKMANLGQIRNQVGLPTPDGFAVTVQVGQALLEGHGMGALVEKEHRALLSPEDIGKISAALQEAILALTPSPEFFRDLLAAYDRLVGRLDAPPRLAVRSSAIGEDTALTFAGQFLSVLNVSREELGSAYLQVLASLFAPEAIHYRVLHGLSVESAAMAVGCIAMVDAAASGIIYSNDPNQPEPGRVVIHAVHGLGAVLADGRFSPEEILVSRSAPFSILQRIEAHQPMQLLCRPEGGVEEVPVPAETGARPILTDAEALSLAGWALQLERSFGGFQDIEWAMDQNRRLILLQSRPLRMTGGGVPQDEPAPGFPVLVAGGETASPGIHAGIAVHQTEDDDLAAFPEGGILITKRPSPKFVRVMGKARAIVTDAGSSTGHMASLAREFRIPALLNTRAATQAIPPGALITVDATNRRVYAGRLPEADRKEPPAAGQLHELPTPPASANPHLQQVLSLIVHLNLVNPRSPRFSIERCQTLHDIARFIHEKSYEEMFHLGASLGDFRSASYYLEVFLPIDLYIIDLGSGVTPPPRGRRIKRKHLTSAPLAAMIRGMCHEKIPRFGPRPLDLGGFFGLMVRHALTNPESERTFRDPCYAIVSNVYLNYTARVGYHFGVVDSYCGKTANKNYINLLFRGGGAELVRRSRRTRAIGAILKELGFTVEVNRDLVTARVSKTTTEETEERLDMVGRLMQFMRQMDLAMHSDEMADVIREAFLKGDYSLEVLGRSKKPG